MQFSRADVSFQSHGATLRGWLYRPRGVDTSPGVVMAHGFTAMSAATEKAIAVAAASHSPRDTVLAVSATREGVGILFEDDSYGWFTRVAAERAPSWRNETSMPARRSSPPAPGPP